MHLRKLARVALGLLFAGRLAAELPGTNLFTSGEGGYAMYRIPSLAATPRGTLLAVCEARTRRDSDWSRSDLLFRRSEDGGRTWTAPALIVPRPEGIARNPVALAHQVGRPEERTLHNPVLIAARDGVVHLLFGVEYNRLFHTRSRDEGRTFEPPRDITSVVEPYRDRYDWKVVAAGPGHGLELGSGRPGSTNARAGRLLVPLWMSTGTGGHGHRPSCIATLFSDDGGTTWQRGDIIANDPEPLKNPSEAMLAELGDGRVLINLRSESPQHRRAVATSPDGATGWSAPVLDEALFEPICQGSLLRVPGDPRERQATLLFSNPDSRPSDPSGPRSERRNLTLRLSADDGRTWPVQRVLTPGPAGYSDLAAGPDGSLWCLFESSSRMPLDYAALTLVRFDLDWMFGEDLHAGTEGFVPLFNGRTLDGWKNINCAPETWTATNGVIACTGFPTGELRTARMFQNFILELEWRHLKPQGNAGVFVWADALTARGQPFHRAVEVQVLDGLEGPGYTSEGDVFPIHGARLSPLSGRGGDRAFPTSRRMNPSPGWNHYRITCINGILTHAVNGRVVTRGVNATPRKGYICLESEGSPAEFRNLRIRELPATTALDPADIAEPDQGFETLYTGLDLRGWLAAPATMSHWKVSDWVLENDGAKAGLEGVLWTAANHGDFELILDYRRSESGTGQTGPALRLRGPAGARLELPPSKPGEWARVHLLLRGNQVEVRQNGVARGLTKILPDLPPSGATGLEPGDATIQFANLFLRRLD